MKTKVMWHLVFILSALTYTTSISWAETAQEKEYNALCKEYKEDLKQKNRLEKELESLQKKCNEALEKLEAKKEKPNSRSYKRALKNVNKYETKMEVISSKINSLNNQIDSLKNILYPPQDISYNYNITDSYPGELDSSTFQNGEDEPDSRTEIQDIQQEPDSIIEESVYIFGENDSSSSPQNASDKQSQQAEKKDEEGNSIVGLIVIIGFFFILFLLGGNPKCPKCGKRMDFVSGCYTWDENQNRVFKKTYICKECGYKKIRFGSVKKQF